MEGGAVKARILGRVVDVRPEERRALLLAFAWFFALLACYYLLRPIREEMGIRGGVSNLKWLFTATFVALALAVPAYSALVARLPRARAVPLVYRFFLLNLLAFFALFLLDLAPIVTARVFFVWLSVFNLFVVSVLWSLLADLFRPEQGRRLFGFVAAGGSLGAIAGSATAGLAVGAIGIANVVLLSAILLEVAARCSVALSHGAPGGGEGGWRGAAGSTATGEGGALGGSALAGVTAVARSRFLLAIAAQVLLYTLASTFLYFQQARIVADALPDPTRRTAVFAAIDLAVNLAAFATQALATGRIVAGFGLAPALATVPVLSGAGFLALGVMPSLAVLAPFQALRRIAHYALERPGRDVLFTVVSREEKYKAKGFLDTLVYRGGDVVSAWIYTGLAALGLGLPELALAAVPAAAASLGVALWLARRERRLEREMERR